MIKPASFIYLITRVHGLKTHLLTPSDITTLARAPSFDAFIEGLMRGEYSKRISLISGVKLTSRVLNRIFAETYFERLYYLIKLAGGEVKKFIMGFASRAEIENIKRVMRAKMGGRKITIEDLIPIPRGYTLINFSAMIEAPTLDEALSLLSFTIYRNVVDHLPTAYKMKSTLPLEAYLESVYFSRLMTLSRKLYDSKIVKSIIGMEADLRNLYFLIGFKLSGVDPSIIESSLITVYYRVTPEMLQSLIRARLDVIPEIISSSAYRQLTEPIMKALETRSVSELEYSISLLFKKYLDSIATRNPLGMGYILWYLYSIEFEYKNLTLIAIGKELGIPEEQYRLII